MTDTRLKRLAKVLVNYCVELKKGQWVLLRGDASALPALREVNRCILEAGAHPTLMIGDESMQRQFYRLASEEQLDWISPTSKMLYEQVDAMIAVRSTTNTRANTNIDARRMQQAASARRELGKTMMRRAADGDLNWTLTQFPTHASAQEAGMSLEEYEDFVYGATFCDRDDPVAEWQKIHNMQQSKVDWLAGKKEIVCKGPNVDLSLSVEGRTFINSDGKRNMPSGEIFTGPVEESVNGWVRFTYPSIVNGRAVKGIELRFEEGKVVEASAEENEDLLMAQLDTDEGARYLGEFAIGTNFGIQQFTGNILFDEKIGGTIHMAIGRSYPETGGKNDSAVHWDMICDMRTESEIHVDGELFYKDGTFEV